MLIFGNDLRTNEPEFLAKPTDVEQIRSFLEGKTQDRVSAQKAVRSLETRLERLQRKTRLLKDVSLSDQVLNLIEN
jgi:hypothetical protein